MTITPQMIKTLRDRTGIGMTKCKEALEESKGDMELAIDNLRKSGMATAVKKEGRATNEGVIVTADDGKKIVLVEVNAETDFVVRNDRFQQFVKDIADELLKTNPSSLEGFLSQKFSKDPSVTIDEYRASIIQMIGENIQIRRFKLFQKSPTVSVAIYTHLGGKLAVAVEITGSNTEEQLAKDIGMHIAAASPDYVKPEEIPADVLEREKDIARSQMKGKPENMIDKIIAGKLNSFYDEVCVTRQKYIRDDSLTVAELVAQKAKETGKPLELASFLRWSVGN